MHRIEVKGFQNGEWIDCQVPEWFAKAIETNKSWTEAFRAYQIREIEDFDCGNTIQVYKAPDGMYCVVLREAEQVIAAVFITSPSDYIRFRAEYIMPNVMLDMAAVQLDERERSRQLRRAS